MNKEAIAISCPACHHEFKPGEALEQTIRAELNTEYKNKLTQAESRGRELARQEEAKAWETKLQQSQNQVATLSREKESLQLQAQDILAKQENIKNLESRLALRESQMETTIQSKLQQEKDNLEASTRQKFEAEFKRKEQELAQQNQALETSYLQKINQEVEKVQHNNDLKVRELTKRLEDQGTLLEEMKRKHEQGSMQLQGEVAELLIEETLRMTFPGDEILPVAKGFSGADTIQVIYNSMRNPCGRIIYESKRTKHFASEWIDKLKTDARANQCDIAVLVSEALPKDMNRFGLVDGIWICTFQELKSMATVLREGMIRAGDLIMAQDNKETKMQLLYDYLTGPQFKGSVEAIVEAFTTMKESLEREKRVQHKLWAEREKQLEKVILSTSTMYGSIKGISGKALEIKSLEYEDRLLEE